MAVLVSWPKPSLHIQSSPLSFHHFQEKTAFIWITIAFYKAFVLELLIFKSYFYINKSFLKEKTTFKNGLLRYHSLGFILELYAVLHLWDILHNISPTWCWDDRALPTTKHVMFFSSKGSSEAHVGNYKLDLLKVWAFFILLLCVNWKVWR